jgi:hypothetical protein
MCAPEASRGGREAMEMAEGVVTLDLIGLQT